MRFKGSCSFCGLDCNDEAGWSPACAFSESFCALGVACEAMHACCALVLVFVRPVSLSLGTGFPYAEGDRSETSLFSICLEVERRADRGDSEESVAHREIFITQIIDLVIDIVVDQPSGAFPSIIFICRPTWHVFAGCGTVRRLKVASQSAAPLSTNRTTMW